MSDGDGARGWQRVGENITAGRRDWHEGLDLYREVDGDGDGEGIKEGGGAGKEGPFECLMGKNKWPKTPEGLKAAYEVYIERMLGLGQAVVRGMGWALLGEGGEEVFVQRTRESFWVVRLIGYPPLPPSSSSSSTRNSEGPTDTNNNKDDDVEEDEDKEGISCGAHTDYGCVTLLLADSTKGALQVQSQNDGTWITADPIPDTFIVNIGDMMQRWTNGLWKSTRHRVIHKGDGYRVSVPFFYEPDFGALVEPLEACVMRTGGTRRWEAVRYGDFLRAKVMGNFG